MKDIKKKVTKFIRANQVEVILLALIFLISAFLRFYRLPEYMTFLGDEVWQLLVLFGGLGESGLIKELVGVATTGFVWWVGREWFNKRVGLIAAFLYAISPVVIIYSRSSWNPNIMPFFALLTIYGIYQFWVKQRFWWIPIVGIALSFALQSHYLGLLLIPVVSIFWVLAFKNVFRKNLYHSYGGAPGLV